MFQKIIILWLVCSSVDYGAFSELTISSPEIKSKSEDAGLLAPTQSPNCAKYKLENTIKTQQLNWIQSVEFCARKNARLAEIRGKNEKNCIVQVFNRMRSQKAVRIFKYEFSFELSTPNPQQHIWIGAFRANATAFLWNHDNTEIQKELWGPNDPQGNKKDFCASVKFSKKNGKQDPKVHALECKLKRACICVTI